MQIAKVQGKIPDLGNPDLNFRANTVFVKMSKDPGDVYLLEWKGDSAFPVGAKIEERSITLIEGGIVKDQEGNKVGIYRRLVQFGGRTGDVHKILIQARE